MLDIRPPTIEELEKMDEAERIKELVKSGDEKARKELKKILEGKIYFPESEGVQKLWIKMVRSKIAKRENL